jgi:hypothetical protein
MTRSTLAPPGERRLASLPVTAPTLSALAAATMPVTANPEANAFLVTDPLALLIGMLLDQQVPSTGTR